MAGQSYQVNVKYLANTSAARPALRELNDDIGKLTAANREAKASLGGLGTAVAATAAAIGVAGVKHVLVDFNKEIQNARIGIASMVQGNLGGGWDKATERASKLYDEFQKFSTQTPVTTQEIVKFGQGVAVSTFQAGGSVQDLIKITEQGTIAAKAFGYESSYTALELSEMLNGVVNQRMMFAKQILGIAQVSEEEFKKLSAEGRLKLLTKTLGSDAFKNAAKEFGTSFSGVTSTMQDKLQIALGKVGLPLFQKVTDEVKKWNEWMDSNKSKLEEISKGVGDGLVKGFNVVKEAIQMLTSKADLLMSIGKIWLAIKIGGMAEGAVVPIQNFIKGGREFFTNTPAKDSIDPFTGIYSYTAAKKGRGFQDVSMDNIAGNVPIIAQSLAVGVALGNLINQFTGVQDELRELGLDKTTREFEKVQKASDALTTALQRAADNMPGSVKAVTNLAGSQQNYRQLANLARDAIKQSITESTESGDVISRYNPAKLNQLRALGVDDVDINKAGGLQKFADAMDAKASQLAGQQDTLGIVGFTAMTLGIAQLTDYQRQTLDEAKATQDVLVYINQNIAKGMQVDPHTIMEILRHDTDDPTGTHKPLAAKPNVTVHINRIEVQSDDPDRIAFGLVESFRDAAKNPSSAFAVLREG